ncbi:MAG: flagellar motor protein MotB, partial [Terriglobales bacterium]
MTPERIKKLALLAALATALSLAGCAKKAAKVTPPAPPAPAPTAPTATLAANPSIIQPGQSSTLTWQTSNANEISIAGLGTLPASGSRSVAPGASTTYTIIAKGPGGTDNASARITVNAPVASSTQLTDEELFAKNVKDIYFDFNKANLRSDDAPVVQNDQAFLLQHPS